MKNPPWVVPLALLLCFALGCQKKTEKTELEKPGAQATLEEQNAGKLGHGQDAGIPDAAANRQEETAEHPDEMNQFQPPESIMDAIGLKPGMVIGEVGAGWGRFTVHLARRVGIDGLVYANDIDKGALGLLEQRNSTGTRHCFSDARRSSSSAWGCRSTSR